MKRITAMAVCALLCTGCASQGQMQQVEDSSEVNKKMLRENENRLHNLENSVSALNTQVAQLNNRVYEVRTRGGQKTAMTVVPIIPGSGATPPQGRTVSPPAAPPAAPASPSASEVTKTPAGKKINPGAKPVVLASTSASPATPKVTTPAPKQAGASGSMGEPENTAGASGQISANLDTALGLPPAEIPVPAGNASSSNSIMAPANPETITPPTNNSNPIPVPVMPASELSLPPEHPDLPPMPAPETQTPSLSASQPAQELASLESTKAAPLPKGEEAAYKAALNAARSGRTAEGIRLFRQFLQQYPNGRYAANADFWIGECLYSQGKYKDALDQFQAVNNTFPKHHKNADALLKAGMALQKMGDNAGAQEKYRQVISSFPNTDAAKRARAMSGGR